MHLDIGGSRFLVIMDFINQYYVVTEMFYFANEGPTGGITQI